MVLLTENLMALPSLREQPTDLTAAVFEFVGSADEGSNPGTYRKTT